MANGAGVRLGRGDLVVVSGGARGITAEVAVALAESFQPRLVLLGRSPAPAAEPAWRAAIHDEAELKRALIERSDRCRPPREVGEEVARILAEREVRRNLARNRGGRLAGLLSLGRRARPSRCPRTHSSQFDPSARAGPGADPRGGRPGRPEDHRPDRCAVRPGLRYQGKGAAITCWRAIDARSLAFLVLFSSSTARFGRAGQVAYAAANEVLNKWAQQRSRPAAALPRRLLQLGTVGRRHGHGRAAAALRERGLALIPPAAGAQLVVDDAQDASAVGPVEIVVLAEHAADARPLLRTAIATGDRRHRNRRCTPFSSARWTWSRCRSSHRTSSTVTPCCRWRSSWNGWPRGRSTATRDWSSAGSTTCASSKA